MPFRERVWGAGKLLLLSGALAGTYFLFAAASMRIALRALEVKVPNLASLPVSDATARLDELGLTVKLDEGRRFDPRIPAGRVASQDPPPNATARRGRSVRLWVSSGQKLDIVPRLIGDSERSAELRLQQDGLLLAGVAEIRSSAYGAGTVVAQDPAPDSQASKVSLLVNLGERATVYVMPDLIGVSGDEAAASLRSKGFRVAVVAEQPYPGLPQGIVLRQHPQAGFKIGPNDPVSLEVSR
jgi:serine/threonine-protein kinase